MVNGQWKPRPNVQIQKKTRGAVQCNEPLSGKFTREKGVSQIHSHSTACIRSVNLLLPDYNIKGSGNYKAMDNTCKQRLEKQ